MPYTPPLQPGESWTPALAAAFVSDHDRDVSAEVVRLVEEMGAAFPATEPRVYRYTAESLIRYYPTRGTLEAQPLAHVMVRAPAGGHHSANVSVVWETGEVVVTGWPMEAGSVWGRG